MDRHIHVRATDANLDNLATIAAHLHAHGFPFPSKSECLRHAITVAATTIAMLPKPKVPAE